MKTYLIRLFRKISLGLSFLMLICAFLLAILWDVMVHTIPVGYAGVHWQRISLFEGAVSRGPLSEGLKIILPWDKIYIYDLRLQSQEQVYQVLSKDGLAFDVEVIFRWRVVGANLVSLNQNIGPNYVNTLLSPEIGSVTREIIALYTAEALFTDARATVQQAIYDRVTKVSLPNGIGIRAAFGSSTSDVVTLSSILFKHVDLPDRISQAIESKLEQAQVVEEYKYRVQREVLESERKRIEAEGIRSFQEIVTPAISESYLRWRGIEATLKLAQSPNTKVVVIGNSATGLPLILDMATAAAAPTAPLTAGAASGTLRNNTPIMSPDDALPGDLTGPAKDQPEGGDASALQGVASGTNASTSPRASRSQSLPNEATSLGGN